MKYFTDISLGILAEASEADSIKKARISSGDLNRKRREKKRVI